MRRYTRETICNVLFGANSSVERPEVADAVGIIFGDLQSGILYLPLWRLLPLPRSRRWNRAVALLNAEVARQIKTTLAGASHDNDLLAALLQARDPAGGAGMSHRQLQDEVLTFFLAGYETAALSLTWATDLLASHPDLQERAAREVHALAGSRPLQPGDYAQLPFLAAVVKEALRLYPPVWSLGRRANRDGLLGSHPIRKGTDVWFCLHRLHRDPRWYPEPDRFLPDRWLGDYSTTHRRFAYAPFGLGPRVCIGQHFASMETVLGLAAMLQRFRLSLTSESPVKLEAWITLRPALPIRLRVTAER